MGAQTWSGENWAPALASNYQTSLISLGFSRFVFSLAKEGKWTFLQVYPPQMSYPPAQGLATDLPCTKGTKPQEVWTPAAPALA